MKEKIHPKFYTDCKVTCGCGNTFTNAIPSIPVSSAT